MRMRSSRKADSKKDEESDDNSADSGSFFEDAKAKAADSQQWSTSRQHSNTKNRKKHTKKEGKEWNESQQNNDNDTCR